MGPLVPDFIGNQLNLIVGMLLGIAFGFVLEQAGFSSSRKLTGLFYGTDFTVLRVFFTAGVTAMSGVLILSQLGLLDQDVIYVNPTFLYPAIVGGLIMGVGFILGGYCPGTSICAAAVGRTDGMLFVLGGLLGIFGFGESYPLVYKFYTSGNMGDLMVYAPLGLTAGQFALLLIVVAVGAFVATTWIEKRVNPRSPASQHPVRYHRAAAVAVIVVGVILAATPDRKTRLLARASDPAYLKAHPVRTMTSDELAFRILDGDKLLEPVDVRSAAEFGKMSLPGAVSVPADSIFGRQWSDVLGRPRLTKVFFASDQATAVRAAAIAGLLGYENVAVLEGGLREFEGVILKASPAIASEAGETLRFRARASVEIAALMRLRSAPKPVRAAKRVQGGCGG
jgi:rhodanese-related sulfurtransferase